MSGLVERRVAGVDQYNWLVPVDGQKRGQVQTAKRGEVIKVSETEAARGEGIVNTKGVAALVDPSVEIDGTDDWAPATDDELEGMNVDKIVAYLGTVPDEHRDDALDQILTLESARSKPRATVLALDPDYVAEDPADAEDPAATDPPPGA